MKSTTLQRIKSFSIFCVTVLALMPGLSQAWWNTDWDTRKKITLNTAQIGTKEALSQVTVLVRLHSGNIDFGNVKENGGDIRFVAEDDKTLLKYHIEKFDLINEMALVWVQVPKLTPGKADTIWMYSGNAKATPADDAKATYDSSQIAVFHFDEVDGALQDRSGNSNRALQSGVKVSESSLIGRGAVFDGNGVITLPTSLTLKVVAAQGYTVSAWVKTGVVQENAMLFQQLDGATALRLGIAGGKLYAAVLRPH